MRGILCSTLRISLEQRSRLTFSYNPSSPGSALLRACTARLFSKMTCCFTNSLFFSLFQANSKVWVGKRFGLSAVAAETCGGAEILRLLICFQSEPPTLPSPPFSISSSPLSLPCSLVSWAICCSRWAGLTQSSSGSLEKS